MGKPETFFKIGKQLLGAEPEQSSVELLHSNDPVNNNSEIAESVHNFFCKCSQLQKLVKTREILNNLPELFTWIESTVF